MAGTSAVRARRMMICTSSDHSCSDGARERSCDRLVGPPQVPFERVPLNSGGRSVALVTLGCARNEVDSEELAGRLGAGGWRLNRGRRRAADQYLRLHRRGEEGLDRHRARRRRPGKKVVAVGCLAERYGRDWRVAARGRRDPGLRSTPTSPRDSTTSPTASRSPRTSRPIGVGCCRSPRCTVRRQPPKLRCPATAGCPPRVHGPGSAGDRSPTSSWRPGATDVVPSVPSRPSGARCVAHPGRGAGRGQLAGLDRGH